MSKDDKDKGNEVKGRPVLVDEEKLKAALRKRCQAQMGMRGACKNWVCEECGAMEDMLFGARVLQEELGVAWVLGRFAQCPFLDNLTCTITFEDCLNLLEDKRCPRYKGAVLVRAKGEDERG